MSIGISIVEDDVSVRGILASWISHARGFRCVSEHPSAESAAARLPDEHPDVVLMDINLPGRSGIECVIRLKPLMPATQFLMLTVYEDAEHIFDALAGGATGYLLKRTPRHELLAALQQVHEGGAPMTSYIARKVVQSFKEPHPDQAEPNGLSPREREVLALLARGFSYKEIADNLNIGVTTVTTHIHHTYEKLHVRSRTEAVTRYSHPPARQSPWPPASAEPWTLKLDSRRQPPPTTPLP